MTAIWETAYEETMKKYPQGYELTRTGLEAEDNVTAVYHRVLSGKALLADFRQAVLDMLDQGLNYEDITAAIGISKGRISQIKSEAISKGILNQKGHYKN
jgi:DNA-directed RNA polymerase specialized sigma subunit